MIDIKEVTSKKQLKQFIKFPNNIYKDCTYYVPPLYLDELINLNKSRNPAFEYCDAKLWLAYKDGILVGRIAGIINYSYIEKWGNKYARFGWMDFIDDKDVSKKLLDTVASWAKDNGLEYIHGPLGFCDLDKEGVLIEGFEEMGTLITLYNHPYYMEHLEYHGFVKDADWIELDIKIPDKKEDINEKIIKIADRAMKRYELKALQFKKKKQLLPYVDEMFDLLNIGYKGLYGVVEITKKQSEVYKKMYFSFVNPDLISFIMDKDNNMVGCAVILPSFSKAAIETGGKLFPFKFIKYLKAIKKNDTVDCYLIAIMPKYQRTGVATILLKETTEAAIRNGIKTAIASPELEVNKSVQSLWRFYEKRIHRRRRCYIKKISE